MNTNPAPTPAEQADAPARTENQEKEGARNPYSIPVSVKDYRNGRHLGLAPISWRDYDLYIAATQDGMLSVPAGEWLMPEDLAGLQIAADHRVYFE